MVIINCHFCLQTNKITIENVTAFSTGGVTVTYLLNRNGNFYYNREVPAIYRDLDPRNKVRVALNTKSKREAIRKAIAVDDQMEAYWRGLVTDNQMHQAERFGKIVHVARQMGFSYMPLPQIIALPLPELKNRILAVEDAPKQQIEAALGAKQEPEIPLSVVLEKYWELAKNKIVDKSADQIRKWRNPRIKAIRNFIAVIGDKELKQVTHDDLLTYRDWWIDRINEEELKPNSANKDLVLLKQILKTVSKHSKIGLDIAHLFEEIMFPEHSEQTRLPFTSEQIINMLNDKRLEQMEADARWLVFAVAGTGARNSEIIGILPENIHLQDNIPHICIVGRKGHNLKTRHSKRIIPLTGYALEAFQARPNGFPDYRDNPDWLTNKANRFLRENDFFPSENHSLYSLRHSFQDRLSEVDAPDRVQAELMGHKFQREKYGNGPSLEKKMEWMQKICLKSISS